MWHISASRPCPLTQPYHPAQLTHKHSVTTNYLCNRCYYYPTCWLSGWGADFADHGRFSCGPDWEYSGKWLSGYCKPKGKWYWSIFQWYWYCILMFYLIGEFSISMCLCFYLYRSKVSQMLNQVLQIELPTLTLIFIQWYIDLLYISFLFDRLIQHCNESMLLLTGPNCFRCWMLNQV